MTPDDKLRFDLSISDLLHLTSLARQGFKKMMPNDRGIRMQRFDGGKHAQAVATLEQAIPESGADPNPSDRHRYAVPICYMNLGTLRADRALLGISVPST